MLRTYGKDVNAVNSEGQTALSVALEDPAWDAGAKLLRQNGAWEQDEAGMRGRK